MQSGGQGQGDTNHRGGHEHGEGGAQQLAQCIYKCLRMAHEITAGQGEQTGASLALGIHCTLGLWAGMLHDIPGLSCSN